MSQVTLKSATYKLALACQVVSVLLITFIGYSLKADISKAPSWLKPAFGIIEYLQESAWWLILLLAVAAAMGKVICYLIGPPWIMKTVQSILDDMQEHAFEKNHNDPVHHHRATLFQHKRFCLRFKSKPWGNNRRRRWPWSGWLVPVLRSGHTTQKSATIFLAPDDAEERVFKTLSPH